MSPRDATNAERLFAEHLDSVRRRADRVFATLLLAEWAVAIILAFVVSPYGWAGKVRSTHLHVYTAVFLGAAINVLPVALALTKPGHPVTRYVVACAQMLWSILLIHLTGGRIETHFHVFGSLAFLFMYRDWRVLVVASAVIAVDHVLRGLFWPESVYGVANPEWWRFLEHAAWVVFEDIVLIIACFDALRESRILARERAAAEAVSALEREKSAELDVALKRVEDAQDQMVRAEKLAAVGQLAASVGHELRNPLAAARNAATFVKKKLGAGIAPALDPKIPPMLTVIEREVDVCARIIGDLLDFARERPPNRQPCSLRALVDEAAAVVPESRVRIVNEIAEGLPVPEVDADQFRQIFINLVQNAVEAIPTERRDGRVTVDARAADDGGTHITVEDNGAGMPDRVREKIFEPLFTTKTKGTGLGLAIVASMVKAHQGTIHVESEVERGTRFVVKIPAYRVAGGAS